MSFSSETAPISADKRNTSAKKWIAFGGFLIGFVWLYFYLGTHLVYQTNRDRLNYDQQHNITLAFTAIERAEQSIQPGESITSAMWRSFPHYTDGVVNPLWPWVASKFADTDHDRFFEKGKWFNVTVTCAFLVLVGVLAARAFSFVSASILMLLGGLGAMLPRAAYFQPEPIYYILFLLSWICALSLLRKNSLWLYGMLGFLFGLSFLAKGGWQPFALVFVGVSFLRFLVSIIQGRWRGDEDERWSLPNQFVGMAVMFTAFMMTAGPRLSFASDKFGDPFHSYPGYWMWMDDFEEGSRFMGNHSSKDALKAMKPEEKPSLGNYLKTHDRATFIERIRSGTEKKMKELMFPPEVTQNNKKTKLWRQILPQRGWLLIWLFIILVVISVFHHIAWRNRDKLVWPVGPQSARWMLLFAFGTFTISSLAFGFYEPIGKGDRFMLGLFLPMVLTFIWVTERFRRQLQRTSMAKKVNIVFYSMMTVPLLVIGFRIIQLIDTPLFWTRS